FPFIGALAWIVVKLVPGEEVTVEYKPKHLDPIFIQQSSTVALSQAKSEIIRMGEYAVDGLEQTNMYITTEDPKHSEMAVQIEGALNNLDRAITEYLVNISGRQMSESDSTKHTALMDSVRDIERIGDHFENIIELTDYKISNKITLTEEAQEDLTTMFDIKILTVNQENKEIKKKESKEHFKNIIELKNYKISNKITLTEDAHEDLTTMFDLTILTVNQAIKALETMDREEAMLVIQKEDQIDKMERAYRKKHIIRMNESRCTGSAGIVFVDIISNLERIGDHAVNIAEEVLGESVS